MYPIKVIKDRDGGQPSHYHVPMQVLPSFGSMRFQSGKDCSEQAHFKNTATISWSWRFSDSSTYERLKKIIQEINLFDFISHSISAIYFTADPMVNILEVVVFGKHIGNGGRCQNNNHQYMY